METLTTNYIYKAIEKYDALMEVLNRPKRDLVPIAVVELIKISICDFLSAFLVENEIKNIDKEDILALQQACGGVNPAFLDLNYESIATLMEDDNFAFSSDLSDETLKRYVETLDRTKDLVVRSVSHL